MVICTNHFEEVNRWRKTQIYFYSCCKESSFSQRFLWHFALSFSLSPVKRLHAVTSFVSNLWWVFIPTWFCTTTWKKKNLKNQLLPPYPYPSPSPSKKTKHLLACFLFIISTGAYKKLVFFKCISVMQKHDAAYNNNKILKYLSGPANGPLFF